MSNLLLTDAERIRFYTWVEQHTDSDRDMIKQLKKMGGASYVIEYMEKKMRAYMIVAADLRNTESMTIEDWTCDHVR